MLLNDEGKLEYIKDNFHPYFDITIESNIVPENVNEFVNFVLPIDKIEDYNFEEESQLRKFFNENFSNVVFTSDDDEVLFKYEVYKRVYFIRMHTFSNIVRMHVLPKKYDASNEKSETPLLLFKADKQIINGDNFSCTSEYERQDDKKNINLYYKENEQVSSSNGFYKFNIKDKTTGLRNLQINSGYSYNDTNPTYNESDSTSMKIEHYTGILDESDENGILLEPNQFTEFNISLMDTNCDNNCSNCNYTNTSQPQQLVNNEIIWPTEVVPYDDEKHEEKGFINPHDINTLYHKTIKYFNGDIYIEEDGYYINSNWDENKIRGV